MSTTSRPLAALIAAACLALPAHAAMVTHTGTLAQDDEVALFSFDLSSTGTVTFQTFGYAGGVASDGTAFSAGGFDPVISLFTAAGELLAIADDGSPNADPVSGMSSDVLFSVLLEVGSYVVALSQFGNLALGPSLSDGFLEAGNGDYTSQWGCSAGRFCDIDGTSRTGAYALEISGSNVVPEPASLALLGAAAVAGLATRRRQATSRRGPAIDCRSAA